MKVELHVSLVFSNFRIFRSVLVPRTENRHGLSGQRLLSKRCDTSPRLRQTLLRVNLLKQRRQSNVQLIQLFVRKNISREDARPSMVRNMFPVERSFARVRKLAKHRSARRSIYSIEMESNSGWSWTKKKKAGQD